jgi:hypothetical protein
VIIGNINPWLHCGIVLRTEEDECQVVTDEGTITSVRYTPRFPVPRRERVLPGHLVAIAERNNNAVVVWRWYDAVVLGSDPESVRLWEPAHGEVAARRRWPERQYAPGTRAYLSAGLPGADWWVEGNAADKPESAHVEFGEVARLYEHDRWDSAFA